MLARSYLALKNLVRSGLFRRTFIYTFSAALNALVNFLLLPVLTRYLTPYDYGIVETFTALNSLFTCIVLMGSNTIVSKEYFKQTDHNRGVFLGNLLLFVGMNSALILLIIFVSGLFGEGLSGLFEIGDYLILLVVVASFFNAVITLLLTLFQLEKKPQKYALFMNSKTLSDIFLSLFFIIGIGMAWEGRISGVLVCGLLFFILAASVFYRRKCQFNISQFKPSTLYSFGVPLMVAQIAGWALEASDKLMVTQMIDLQSTGLYSVGYKFGMVVMILGTAFSRAWLPFFFEKINENSRMNNLKIVRATYLFMVFIGIFSIVYGFCGEYLLYLVIDERFHMAGSFVMLISIGYFFDGIWKLFIGYLIHEGRTKIYSGIVLFSGVLNVVLNYVLISRIGLIGAAWATLMSFAVGAVLTIAISTKIHPMPWFDRDLLSLKIK